MARSRARSSLSAMRIGATVGPQSAEIVQRLRRSPAPAPSRRRHRRQAARSRRARSARPATRSARASRRSSEQLGGALEPGDQRRRQVDAGRQAPAADAATIGTDEASTRCAGPTGSPKIVSCRRSSRAPKPISRPNAGSSASHGSRREGRGQDQELAREDAERRQAGRSPARPARRPTASTRMGDAQPADLGDALRALGLGDVADGEEDRRLGQAVHGHVQQAGEIGERPAHAEGERDDAHVLDRGIGEQPLDVAPPVAA